MMRLSISNIGWTAEDDLSMYRRLAETGFQGLEIAPTRIFPQNPYDQLEDAAGFRDFLLKEFGLTIPSMQSIWYGKPQRIAEAPELLEDYTVKALDFAQAVGCPNLVFGCPRNRTVLSGGDAAANEAFFCRIAEAALARDAVIALEPNPPIYNTNYLNTTTQALALLKKLDHPALMLNLDVGTMVENGEDVAILEGSARRIHHVHISEPGLKPIRPRPLHRELKAFLEDTGYDGFVSIEMGRPDSPDDLLRAMDYVCNLFL